MHTIQQIGYMPGYGLENPYTFTRQFAFRSSMSVDTILFNPEDDYKILMQSEPPNLYIKFCGMVKENADKFDLILTYDDRLLELPNAVEFCPVGSWISDGLILDKKNQISFMMSSKINGYAYIMRFMIMKRYQHRKHIGPFEFLFWRSPPRYPTKDDFFRHSKFNIACENQIMTNMFTEKLLDCFKTYTVPIYYGCTNISKYFNPRGILQFNTIDELEHILNDLHLEQYQEMLPYLHENYELGKPYWEKNVYQRIEDIVEQRIAIQQNSNFLNTVILD